MTYSRHPRTALLTAAQEVELAKKIAAGVDAHERISQGRGTSHDTRVARDAEAARAHFIQANIGLVLSLASKARIPNHVDRDDVIQDGMLGLDRAITKFDWQKGYKFSTYATWWIKQGIQRGLENTASTVRIPAHKASELRTALATDEQAALAGRLRPVAAMSQLDSLDRTIGDTTIAAHIASDSLPDLEAERLGDIIAVRSLLTRLEPKAIEVLVARYGLDGTEPKTFGAIAEQLGISAEAARRRTMRALEALRPAAQKLLQANPDAVLAA